jgi:hypothetical protein
MAAPLNIEVDTRIGGPDVKQILENHSLIQGKPENSKTENVPECTTRTEKKEIPINNKSTDAKSIHLHV